MQGMASKLSFRNLQVPQKIRSLLNPRARRRWISLIKLGNEARDCRFLSQVPDARKERDLSVRSSARFAGRDFEDRSSDESSFFEHEPDPEWMQSDSMDDSGWYHETHGNSSANQSSQRGKKEDAEKIAVQWLAKRAFTAAELVKKLHGKNYHPDTTKSVIDELKSRGFLNDGLYAESFSRSRWASLNWGPQKIKQVLRQKGVDESDIARALDLVFKDESGKSGFQAGMSEVSMNRLLDQASKQWLRGQTAPLTNRRARMVRWLQYRGFDWSVTSFVLKKLESRYPP